MIKPDSLTRVLFGIGSEKHFVNHGNCLDFMRWLPDGCIQTCVTSPPYYGQIRDYGIDPTIWGGNSSCNHVLKDNQCVTCNAWLGVLGNEAIPDCNNWAVNKEPCNSCYICHLRMVFSEVYRVLRNDGTLWLNLGDTTWDARCVKGYKPKDFCMIPHRAALALQADNWWCRSDICWDKPNSIPESVNDRPSRSHEYLFLLTKTPVYFYDAQAIRETSKKGSKGRHCRSVWNIPTVSFNGKRFLADFQDEDGAYRSRDPECPCHGDHADEWYPEDSLFSEERPQPPCVCQPVDVSHTATMPLELATRCIKASIAEGRCKECGKAWGGSEQQRCACGSGFLSDDLEWIDTPTGERVADDPSRVTGRAGLNRPRGQNEGKRRITRYQQRMYAGQLRASISIGAMREEAGPAFDHYVRTDVAGARPIPEKLLERWIAKGWLIREQPPRISDRPLVPCLVLDPFAGSGTTAVAAIQQGGSFIGSEMRAEYVQMIEERIRQKA